MEVECPAERNENDKRSRLISGKNAEDGIVIKRKKANAF